MTIKEFEKHLHTHELRNLVINTIKSEGYSVYENFERHEPNKYFKEHQIILTVIVGRSAHGNSHPQLYIKDVDTFEYKWGTIHMQYAQVYETWMENKHLIPKDL